MTIRTRKIIFYLLCLVFIVAGGVTIFYSNGWRFDFETLSINRLGALYFEVTPQDALITIDKTSIELSSGILKSGTLVANIFPKEYSVKITREGYQSWAKELYVKPSLVTLVSPVLLLPEKLELGIALAKNVQKFWVGPKYTALLKTNGYLEINSARVIGNELIAWSKDGFNAITKSDSSYFATDLSAKNAAVNLSLIFKKIQKTNGYGTIQKIDFSPINKKYFIVLTDNGLYFLDAEKTVINLIDNQATDFFISNEKIFFIKKGGIYTFMVPGETINEVISYSGDIKNLIISSLDYYLGIMETDGQLSVFDNRSRIIKQISDNTVSAAFSPDGKRIAFITGNNEVVKYPLEQTAKYTEEQIARFNLGSVEKNIIWHKNSGYIYLKYPGSLYLLEMSDLPPINMQILDSDTSEFQYNEKENSIYMLKNGSLYKAVLE